MTKYNEVWDVLADAETMKLQRDVCVYWSGGMWIHPCGRTYQEAGRDGFEKKSGRKKCRCKICNKARSQFVMMKG